MIRTAEGETVTLLNPRISDESAESDEQYEGCLSFFGVRGMVPRPLAIEVEHQDIDGTARITTFERGMARLVYHEVDHLFGVLYRARMKPGVEPIPAVMKRGDVLFFNGNVIHGSYKNNSDRFRRTLIGHYISAEAKQVAKYYFPVFRMDGSILDSGVEESITSGPCGVYEPEGVSMSGHFKTWEAAH